MKKTIRFIVNPFSGTTSKEDIRQLLNRYLDQNKFDHEVMFTEFAGHATQLARQGVEENLDIVTAVGGDGSVNEVAQALVYSDSALGILPGGSGNGFAMHFGIGRNLKKAIEKLNTSTIHKVDSCKVNERFFINVAGIGYDARIAYLTKKNSKRGFLPYFKTTLKESKHYKPAPMRITIDGMTIDGSFAAAVVANASMYGYNFTIAPKASLQDGLLDITLIKNVPVYRYFLSSYRFLNRTIDKSSIIDTYQGKEIRIELMNNEYIHVDGEGFEAEHDLVFKIAPLSLKVAAPPQ